MLRGRPPIPFGKLVAGLVVLTALVTVGRAATDGDVGVPSTSAGPVSGEAPSSAATPKVRHSPKTDELPACRFGQERARPAGADDWDATLVDTRRGLKPSYAPPDLVSLQRAGFSEPFLVRSLVIDDLAVLRLAAERAGNRIGVAAAYRSYASQDSLYRRRIQTEGHKMAQAKTARPGHSEHQLGTTLDFKTAGALDVDSGWEAEPEGKWLAENAWKYGFVMSYPAGRTRQTCYWYEPWHYRYFGREKAAAIHRSGLTVREYLWNEQEGSL